MKITAPLSKSQYGIYAECVGHENEPYYNLPFIFVLDGSLDAERLCRAIETTIKAHPTLFSRIEVNEEGDPFQTLDMEKEDFSLSVEPITDIEAEKQQLIVPFKLYGGRLFHIRLMRDAEHFYWFFDMHHIIGDGSSLNTILHDAARVYGGGELSPEVMTMAEVATAEAEMRKTAAFEEGKQWYAQHFDCSDTFTPLLPDLEIPEHTESHKERTLGTDMAKVEAFCKANGIFKSTLFTAAYAYLLAKYNNEEESLFTTIYNGRTDQRFLHSVGMTVKTLPVYATFADETTVLDFLKAGQEQMAGCRQHDIYAYTDLMEDLNLQTNSMFAWHGMLFADTEFGGMPMQTIQLCNNTLEVSLYLMAYVLDNQCHLRAEYNSNEYSESLIAQFMESYEATLEGFLTQTYLRDVDITTKDEIAVLDSFNPDEVSYDNTQTIVSLFRRQAAATPDNEAVVFQDHRYTYAQVDDISERIAAYILSKGLKTEEVVSVLIPRCEWMAIASLGVLKAGCAYQPLDPSYPKERLNFMMKDADAKLLICDESLRDVVDEYHGEVLFTKDLPMLPPAKRVEVDPKPENLFILLYTSGSTGVPKGCQLEHRNIVAFCHWYQRRFELKPEHHASCYASYGFDCCMMDLYPALTCGASVYVIGDDIRLSLPDVNDYFNANHITHSFMTTQVAYQFATNMDNHSLLHLVAAGEKLASLVPPSNFKLHNGYGPTEGTILITEYEVDKEMKDIPVGKPLDNNHLYIVDKYGHRVPQGALGELWISGPHVTRSYLNRPEKTAEVYIQNPFTDNPRYARIYRTGDIVRYLPDGNIQFVGRKDGQVKIRGFRIELKEVESIIRQFKGIKDVTVQAFDEEGGGKFIAAYIVADEQIDIEALNNFILEEKPPYMVPAVTMQIDRIPLNQNQKVNKKALPKPEKKAAEDVVESNVPMNLLEKELHDIIAGVVGTQDFGVTTILGYVGLTSISAIKLAIQMNKRFGIILDSKALAKSGSLQYIENEILNHLLNTPSSAQNTSEEQQSAISNQHSTLKNIPLSYAQMGVYVDCMKQPSSTVYNIPAMIRFPKGTDAQLLGKSVETVIKAHPQFHVHFGSEGSDIVQIVDATQPIVITQSKLSEAELEKYKVTFVKPFNLKKGPLYRMEIVTTEEQVYLLADVHHLIFDGGSLDLFINQLCELMNGHGIETEAISYADFVADEKAAESTPSYAEAKDFFNERLGKLEGVTEVPSDLTNPIEQGVVRTVSSKLDFTAMEAFCKQHNLSPAHLTLAAVFYSLSRFTNNEQICITTISNGRSDLRIRNTVGMFVNTLALSAQIGEQSVMDFLNETSQHFDETLRHENYPFAQIAADYDLSAEIMFAYQMGLIDHYVVNGQKLEVETLELDVPKFRIAFYIQEKDGVPSVCIEYDNGRYSESLMQHLAQSVCNAVNAFIRQPETALLQVSLLDAEQTVVLDSFNQTEVPYDHTQNIVSLFRRQVEQTPDNLAVVYHEKKYTYREVDAISERIAAYIASQGLGNEDVVSVLIPRCEWMAIASLGVLKAGCAYQPLDPSYPAERLNFMMKDANAKLLIADEELRPIVNEYQGKVLLTKDIATLETVETPHETPLLTPSSLFILLYTSGSTGTPKGCQLEHGNIVAFCHWYQRHYGLTANDRVAAYASYGFDACMMDLYPALTCGACVHIIGDDIRLNLPDLNDYFNTQGITHSFITTQVGYQFATNVENHSLRCFAVGGEKLSALNPPTNYKMYNGYGPTECTIFTTNYWVKDYELDIPIGKPLDNLKLYIVDKQFNRLPIGAAGELWVSGQQVSRGYLNRPEKTAETFLKNPFSQEPGYERIYRTGDIVRYLPDGNIQFVGRKDGQVKIRGFRIELKEVEAVIREFPGIKDVTVQAFDYENGGKYIAAYIVSDEKVDIKQLNAFIGQQKPPYMIPAATMQIDSIPLNQNQKVNRKALPDPVIQAADREYVAPANETERQFCKIFGDILAMDKISATDNFFDLGGTSLMVTRVILEADKIGYHIAYGDVFSNNTPRKLAALVMGNTDTSTEEEDVFSYDYSAIHNILKNNTLDSFLNGERQTLGNVLLTGATGYLGIHVLQELIGSDVPKIYCLVRDKNLDAAEHRLKTLLFYYFESTYDELFGKRLNIVLGDVTNDLTALVKAKIDTVFNCAAVVKHFSEGTEIEDVNIGGAQRCVDFCLKTGARLVHISTYSTSGLNVNDTMSPDYVFTEQRLYDGQYLGNQYIHSKFIAERVVLQSIVDDGLSAKVIRVGNLAARARDGEFQINFSTNSYMGRIKVYNMLGCCPYSIYDSKVEFSPIDEVAQAIILLSSTPKECCVFHTYNNHSLFLGDVLSGLNNIGTDIRFVEDEEYNAAMESAGNDPEKARTLASLVAYQDMAHGKKASFVPVENPYTSQVLYRLGFKWSPTTWDYVDQMLSAISGLGFFD